MARYSLANYTLGIKLPSDFASRIGLTDNENLIVGGEGSYLDSFSVEMDTEMYKTKGDATGSWVHDRNLSKVGKVTISLHQLSNKISKFIKISNLYYSANESYEGFELTLYSNDNQTNTILNCKDCYFQKIPNQEFGQESGNQSWVITCGAITFSD